MDILPTLLNLLLVVFLIFMNGFFVAAEFCCVKMRPSRLETLIAEGSSRAGYAKPKRCRHNARDANRG